MSKDEALDLALEALQTLMIQRGSIYDKAITAIKQARSAPVQEPIAQDVQEKCRIEAVPAKVGLLPAEPVQEPVDGTQVSKVWWDGEKLMAKPIPLVDFYQPVQDSTCNETLRAQGKAYPRTCRKCGLGPCIGAPKQPPAAQRQWVGLTDEEVTALKRNGERYISSQDFARAIEAKLKEKNNG
jgi:hypothetical protein